MKRLATRILERTLIAVLLAWSFNAAAQTVTVDATPSHVVNKFSPLYALGSTVDRVPSNATDVFLSTRSSQERFSRQDGA